MTNTAAPTVAPPAPKSLVARFVGIVTAPRETFEAVVAHPKWLGMLLLTTAIITAGAVLPMTTEAGRQATLDMQVRQMESFGMTVNDEIYAQMQKNSGITPYTTAASLLVVYPIIALVSAGILFAVFNAAMGGTASFKQVYAVVVHTLVISAVAQMFTGPLNYFRQSMASATNLAVMLPMLEEGSFLARLAGMIDLFLIWSVIVLAIGLAVLFRRKTQPIAITFFAVYAVIALVAAVVMSRLGGTN